MAARRDYANVTKTPTVEKPYWFLDDETGWEYYGIFGGIGWPQKVVETDKQRSGYAVVVGVLKRKGEPPLNASFIILDEVQEHSVDILLEKAVSMRKRWGYGAHKSIMPVFIGDHRQFEMTVADYNTKAVMEGREQDELIVSPPDEFDNPQAFDVYLRRLHTVLSKDGKRLHLARNEIIQQRIIEFMRDDPAITAVGGLVHALLLRTPWMEQSSPAVFSLGY